MQAEAAHSCFQILSKQSARVPLATPFPYQKVNSVKHVPEGFLSTPVSAWPTAGALVATPHLPAALVTASPPTAVLEQKACTEPEPWLVVYLLLGLCLCTLICSLLLGWTHLRRKGEVVSCQASTGTCHRREDSSKGECWLHWGGWGARGGQAPRYCWEGQKAEPVRKRGRERKQTTCNAVQSEPGRGAGLNPPARILHRNPLLSHSLAKPQARLPAATQGWAEGWGWSCTVNQQLSSLYPEAEPRGGGVAKSQPSSRMNHLPTCSLMQPVC